MAGVGSGDISFSSLRTAWGNASYVGGSDPGTTNISLSEFRGATFTDGTSVPSSGEISIDDDFKDKTFGSSTSSIVYNTGSFRVYDNWSAYSAKLKGTTGSSTFTGSTTANKRIQLYSGQSSSFPYSIILLTPNATNSSTPPGIIVDRTDPNAVDEVTVWFKVIAHNTYRLVQFGIIAKDMTLNNWTTQKSYLHNKHGTYADRLSFHGWGYHNYAGSRDDITSSSTVVSPQYKSGTYGGAYGISTLFHNRTGSSAGTMRSYNAPSAPSEGFNMYFFKNSYQNYSDYRGASKYPNHGLKIKWYETTLQVKLVNGSSTILPVSGNWSTSDLSDVFSGMYVSGTGISTGDGAFIGDIHTNYMVLYKGKGTTALSTLNAISDQTNTTITISGYLYWTLTTESGSDTSDTNYTNPKIFGPPHTVLPKYQAASSGSTSSVEIKEWAYYIGDTTSGSTNTFTYDLRNTDPSGTPFSYSVSYSSGTVPPANTFYYYWKYYAFGASMGTLRVYWYSGTTLNLLRTVSGQQHTGTSQTWNSYTENLTNYAGQTGYIVYAYQTGSYWTNDPQIDSMYVNKNNSTLANIYPSTSAWRRYAVGTSTTSTITYTTTLSIPSITSSNWVTLLTSSSTAYGWQVDNAGTPSSSTGNNLDATGSTSGTYIYFEGSSPNYSTSTRYYWLRTANSITLS